MTVTLAIATAGHVADIAARMRPEDRAEVLASGGYSPEAALRASLTQSVFARTAFIDGEAAAMFGVVEAGVAIPWLLTTDTVCRYPLTFWKASKVIFREMREAWPDMLQQIDARYASALSWARRLGFSVAEPQSFGESGLPFRRITIGGRRCANH